MAKPGGEAAGQAPQDPGAGGASPYADALAQQGMGVPSGPASTAPYMIGDMFGSGGIFVMTSSYEGIAPSPGGTVPRFKMAENTSPLPQDRLYFDYSFYNNVPIADPAISVNAVAPGFEKTFFSGLVSFEMRMPLASTLDDKIYLADASGNSPGPTHISGEIGDMAMAFKGLFLRCQHCLLSGGLSMTLPTAEDTLIYGQPTSTSPSVVFDHKSIHVMPFLGMLWTPSPRCFAISYLQFDIDTNGDPVSVDEGNGLTGIGRYRDPTFMYFDFAVGYWVCKRPSPCYFLTGLAPVFEVHVNQALARGPVLSTPGGFQIGGDINGDPLSKISIVDLTVGVHAELCCRTLVTFAYCAPATTDRQFDGQFRLLVNRRF
jgi:hypothetical protein